MIELLTIGAMVLLVAYAMLADKSDAEYQRFLEDKYDTTDVYDYLNEVQ